MNELDIDREALLQTFLAEADEIFGRMEQSLVALETHPGDDEILHALFRDAHTMKGSAGLVGFDAVRDLAHELEAVLERVRGRTLHVTDGLITLLLRSVDVLRRAVTEAAGGVTTASDEVVALRGQLAAVAGGADQGAASPAPGAPAEAAADVAAAHLPAGGRTLRVDVAKLDRMLDLSGEIAISRGRLGELLERRQATIEDLIEAHREADRLYLDLQELVMKARMVPIGPSFHRHVRTIRDVATAQGKLARLVVEGDEVEVDTAVVEYVRDPLTHMVRNAVDHGIEAPEVRRARGKDPTGRVVLRAFHEAGSMVIQVEDDGAGLDRRRIAEKAASLGLAADASRMTDDDLARVVFEPGLTTVERVTEISGRGVGMDVVRRNVEALRGSVSIESEDGAGTTVTIRVPLTLAIIQGFKIGVSGEVYILPLDAVLECLDLPVEETASGTAFGIVNLRGHPLPYVRLREHLGTGGARPARENVVVVQHGSSVAGLAVDELHGESSTVIKPLGTMFKGIPGVAGSSILGDGKVALILDVPGLLRETLRQATRLAEVAS
jgi:two-component system chemotaxis sensor kinase CheA